LSKKNKEECLVIFERAVEADMDIKVFLKLLIRKIRFVLLLKYSPKYASVLKEENSDDELKFLEKLSKDENSGINFDSLSSFLSAYDQMNYAYSPEIPLEIAFMKI
jgi:hypothetical protein